MVTERYFKASTGEIENINNNKYYGATILFPKTQKLLQKYSHNSKNDSYFVITFAKLSIILKKINTRDSELKNKKLQFAINSLQMNIHIISQNKNCL